MPDPDRGEQPNGAAEAVLELFRTVPNLTPDEHAQALATLRDAAISSLLALVTPDVRDDAEKCVLVIEEATVRLCKLAGLGPKASDGER
jgi:hypothetical protein